MSPEYDVGSFSSPIGMVRIDYYKLRTLTKIMRGGVNRLVGIKNLRRPPSARNLITTSSTNVKSTMLDLLFTVKNIIFIFPKTVSVLSLLPIPFQERDNRLQLQLGMNINLSSK